MTSRMAPLVPRMSTVNITMMPGTACSKPLGGTIRSPADSTCTLSARGMAARAASPALSGAAPASPVTMRSASRP